MIRYGLAITVSPWKTLIGRVPCSTFDALNPPPNRCIFCMWQKARSLKPKIDPSPSQKLHRTTYWAIVYVVQRGYGYRPQKNNTRLDCNYACIMFDATKFARVVAYTPRTSNHLHVLDTDLNNHHQKAKVRTFANKSTIVISSEICWFTPRLQKWDVDPKICTELFGTYCHPRKCLWLRHHVVFCRLLNLLKSLCVNSFFSSKKWLKWNWNGHWEWLQKAWTLKIVSNEPKMCWGCVDGRGLFVVASSGCASNDLHALMDKGKGMD